LKRYQLTNKFLKESKQFGSQRQTSEALAVRIGLENLARTAGFLDPIRLTWAMETKETGEIIAKAKPLTFDKITISLVIDAQGKTHLAVEKADKKLKSVPAKYRNNSAVKQLLEHKKTLTNQYSRARRSLEYAMNRGDEFSLKEIQMLSQHPVVSPMLKNLVLVVASENGLKMGFPDTTWQQLISPHNESYPLAKDDKIRIAHCVDLDSGGDWSEYQHECFVNKRVQPFKQIFRELYLITEDEKAEKSVSRRYAGHQVQPTKTVALLKTRGWRVDYEDYETGLQKVFHQENFVATIYAMADWFTPADVEAPTLETVQFLDRKTWKKIAFEKINARLFSEVMRDIDLVVSVAHAGGVDPEASHSTVEMRSVLINETAKLLGFNNLQLQKNHAILTGEIGNYSVHLSSGVVHRQPGGYISILPVHSSHRGRIFLPFADDDPKTAEIISKILLLVNDKEIKDPTILQQLHG
jgi:thiol-disulfide isomerase/thioredoxin